MQSPPLAQVDWTVVLQTVGSVFVLVLAAVGGWTIKIMVAQAAIRRDNKEAEDKRQEAARAGERKDRKDTLTEYRDLLQRQRTDVEDWREQVHELRGELQRHAMKLAVCEWDRRRLEYRQEDQEAALLEHGIVVRYRQMVEPRPTNEGDVRPHGPAGSEETTVK
jgi:septal ring factor EnvC (AmiA/AmiB activator)